MRPTVFNAIAAHPKPETEFFWCSRKGKRPLYIVSIEVVAIAEFVETDVAVLVLDIMLHTSKPPKRSV